MKYKRITVFLPALAALSLLASQGCVQTGMVAARHEAAPARPAPSTARPKSGIKWMRWGRAAFDAAKTADKPIYLDIHASWCKWCREMDRGAYSDPRVIGLINRDFVPVSVDADARPDIDARYNRGGWPTVAVLTPSGGVIAGKTYMSADDLIALLDAAKRAYNTDKKKIYERINASEKEAKDVREKREKGRAPVPLSAGMPYRVLNALNLFVDPRFGGYGGPDKFPMPEVLEFGLYVYPKVKDYKDSPKAALTLTLDGMADGLLDREGGGFFRYSTSLDWKTPHYEKLLSLNGDLLGIYMRAYQLLGAGRYREIGQSVAGYLKDTLYDSRTGAFFNSQEADERYYKADEGGRQRLNVPAVDRAIYADSNARAALGFLRAYRATGDDKYLKTALGTVDYITHVLYWKDRGVLHSSDSGGKALFLSDNVYAALAAEQAYQATGDRRYLEFAVEVAGLMVRDFWDAEGGGFFDVSYKDGPPGLLGDREKPQTENSKAAILLMDLYHLTGQEVYRKTARRALAPFTAEFARYTFWAAPFALAVERCVEPTYEFMVVGRRGSPDTAGLVKKSYTFADPDRVVVPVDPDRDKARLADLGYEFGGRAMLYVCSDRTCFPPVSPGDSMEMTRERIAKAREPVNR